MHLPENGVLLRIFIDEGNKIKGKPLYEIIVHKAKELNFAGATVLRGILGFGANSRIHSSKILRLSEDLPIVIEIIDTKENIDTIMPFLDKNVNEGLITLEKIKILKYK